MCNFMIVVVSAKWCGSCRMLKKSMEDKGIPFQVIDADDNSSEVERLGIEQLPTVIAYDGEKEVGRWVDGPSGCSFENWYLKTKREVENG